MLFTYYSSNPVPNKSFVFNPDSAFFNTRFDKFSPSIGRISEFARFSLILAFITCY